ncbi:MAG: ATP-grasp domain-containing protein [Deltaproteobacteria bacterium]|nr:MAG: ATP-grasp domain-containing protein [Deltaproteobacteria bacterium]
MCYCTRVDRVLVIAATTAYQTGDLVAAAGRVGVEVVLATDRCQRLAANWWAEGPLAVDFRRPERAADAIVAQAGDVAGVVATDERTAVIAALVGERLGLPHNAPSAARATADKLQMRRLLAAGGVAQPAWRHVADWRVPGDVRFPVVVKPRHLSTSRGVMRADDPDELAARLDRLRALVSRPDVAARAPADAGVLVEQFVPGPEVAFEGLVVDGEVRPLALFDKPEPLDGPFFAETIYVTPSRLPGDVQRAIRRTVAAAAAAIGLRHGPVHAELRLAGGIEPVVVEVAARSIGGLCGRALRFGAGVSLEEVVIAHAVGRDVGALARERAASGVLMLPVERAGVLRGVRGADAARAVPGVVDVVITARRGDILEPLPEGHAYLGFAFARGDGPDQVVAALAAARARLDVDVAPRLA